MHLCVLGEEEAVDGTTETFIHTARKSKVQFG